MINPNMPEDIAPPAMTVRSPKEPRSPTQFPMAWAGKGPVVSPNAALPVPKFPQDTGSYDDSEPTPEGSSEEPSKGDQLTMDQLVSQVSELRGLVRKLVEPPGAPEPSRKRQRLAPEYTFDGITTENVPTFSQASQHLETRARDYGIMAGKKYATVLDGTGTTWTKACLGDLIGQLRCAPPSDFINTFRRTDAVPKLFSCLLMAAVHRHVSEALKVMSGMHVGGEAILEFLEDLYQHDKMDPNDVTVDDFQRVFGAEWTRQWMGPMAPPIFDDDTTGSAETQTPSGSTAADSPKPPGTPPATHMMGVPLDLFSGDLEF